METYKTISFALLTTLATSSLADDAVGLVRVDAGTNGVVETEMPFSPIGDSGPLGYVSGAFLGDGGEFSDQLFRYDASTGETTNAVWSASAWLDPFTWLPSFMQAFPGDSLSLLRADSEPFSFHLFGRASGIAYRTGAPRFRSMAVDPTGEFADFSVFTRGLTTDLFLSDFATNHGDASSWFHVGRYPGHSILFAWRDAALPTSGGRVYLVADATRDSDGDGLPDEMERRVYGTSPYLSDTDGDGLSDSLELAWGSDPLVAGAMPPMSLFSEPFEPPAVVAGPIDGQNGWTAGSRPASAVAQGEIVYEGSGALELNGGTAAHSVTCSAQVVWVDQRVHSECGVTEADIPQDVTAFFYFDVAGHPVMSDGMSLFTNLAHSVVGWRRWTRCTMKFDYASRTWDMYVDGVIVGEGLSMRGDATAFNSIGMSGAGVADNLRVTTDRPLGLSSDGDELPDEWEIGHFGDLSHDGTADSDGDGMSDLVEFHAGTDPLAHNGDTDGDGLPDWWEAANGLNPLRTNDFARAAFRETFESPAVEPGDIAGQNGWRSSRSGAAEVQSRVVRSGSAALSIKGGQAEDNEDVQVSHSSASHADIVWMDIWQTASRGCDWCELPAETFAVIAFDGGGHPVLSDGDGFVTNLAVCVEDDARWVRCTCRYDFPNRKWDFYLDGVLVSPGLSMRGTTASIHAFDLYGGSGCVDDIYVGIARPEGLSSDGDMLPDEWEWRNIGSLGRDGTGDLDNDGLSDFDEYAAGTNPASADTDGDGLPDAWEIANSLDPLNAADSALDSDGDGLSNLAEFNAGTDPHLSDTDGDGLPDAWELSSGTDPFTPDAHSDPDGDGLVNLDEMRFGSNPFASDTDGDGVDDLFEIRNSRSNPLVSDMACETAADIGGRVQGASASGSTGTWRTDSDGTIYAAERAGSLTWNLEVPSGGADALAVSIGQHNLYSKAATFDLSLYVDGLFVARQVVTAPYGTRTDAFFFLPEIPSGEHEFRLVWRNWEVNTFLAVHDLRFVSFGGADADGNGVPDWKDYRAAESSALGELPLESLVSPLCIEGRDLWRDILDVEVEYPETNAVFATVKTIGDGFYADIPLPENGTATISLHDRSLAESFSVSWRDFDVFDGEYATNAIVIRTGDALKIAPHDDGESEVAICRASNSGAWSAITNWTESVSTPYVFETQGMYLVTVSREGLFGSDVGYALVDVVRSRFPKRNPAILLDAEQTLSCPQLSPRNVLEHDAELQLGAEVAGSGVTLSLLTHADRDLGLVSRLSDGGAISDAVQVTPMWADNGTYYRVADTFADGSQLVEVSLLLGAVPEGTTVALSIFVSGVTFEDGTRTKTLTAADFDENGHCTIRFIRARGVKTSVCHSTRIYQDGKLIYKNR